MTPEDLRNALKQAPFEPFRMVTTDGKTYDVRHPDLILVGKRAAVVGLASQPDPTLFEQTVKVDLLHVIRLETLPGVAHPEKNGPS